MPDSTWHVLHAVLSIIHCNIQVILTLPCLSQQQSYIAIPPLGTAGSLEDYLLCNLAYAGGKACSPKLACKLIGSWASKSTGWSYGIAMYAPTLLQAWACCWSDKLKPWSQTCAQTTPISTFISTLLLPVPLLTITMPRSRVGQLQRENICVPYPKNLQLPSCCL